MITMENVLKRGRTVWDRQLLPEDEYAERVRALRERMAQERIDALVSIGHSNRPGNFTYLSGHVPPLRWMGVVLGREAGPVLVSGGGSREVPFVRSQTWIEDIRTSRSLFTGPAEVVASAVGEIVGAAARVGVAGIREDLTAADRRELLSALDAYEVIEADALMMDVRAVKRPREIVALERSLSIAREAVDAARKAWRSGASNTTALLTAEHTARMRGSRDVRVLGNVYGAELAPVEELSDDRPGHLVTYCAVEHLGYWGEACGTTMTAPDATSRAVGAMVKAARPGVTAGELAGVAQEQLPVGEADLALAHGFGNAVGLDLAEPPIIRPGCPELLTVGTVLALRAVTVHSGKLSCASETIRLDADGATAL